MNNIKTILQEIIKYYQRNKGVGHTHAMLFGVIDTTSIIIAHNWKWGAELQAVLRHVKSESHPMTVHQFPGRIEGLKLPLVWDNQALEQVLQYTLQTITDLEHRIKHLEHHI